MTNAKEVALLEELGWKKLRNIHSTRWIYEKGSYGYSIRISKFRKDSFYWSIWFGIEKLGEGESESVLGCLISADKEMDRRIDEANIERFNIGRDAGRFR